MEPDLMECGTSLEEAQALRREHDDLLLKLNVSSMQIPKQWKWNIHAFQDWIYHYVT